MRSATLLTLSALALLVSCGSSPPEVSGTLDEQVEETDLGATATATTAMPPSAPPGTIARADLRPFLEAGPGALLAEVRTEPVLDGKRFVGFRITAFARGEPTAIDLKAGDVIVKVNGRTIERPENYFQIFEELGVASELRFELIRDGQPKSISYPIVD